MKYRVTYTAEDFDFSRSIIIWCFIRWMKKLKWYM